MKDEDQIDDALIGRFLAGEASPDEAIAIHDWVSRSEINGIHFEEMEKAWTLGKENKKPSPNKKTVWMRLQQTIERHKPERRKPVFTLYRIAAAILLLISATALYFIFSDRSTYREVAWETKQAKNEVIGISLPDGSSVTVNRNSTLKWLRKPEGIQREVLLEGEAYFDVAHNAQNPFVIHAHEIQIKVLGTAFNVLANNGTDEIETEVTRGKVMMSTTQKQIIVEAGMKGIYKRHTKELILLRSINENNIAYSTHSLSFASTKLSEVGKQLSKAYGVKFVFVNNKIQDCLLTSEYHNRSLSFIMNVIAESLNIKYTLKENTVYISGDGCL